MAAVVPSSDQTADLLQDLHLDSENKSLQARDSTKQVSSVQYAPVEPGTMANGMNKPFERSTSPFNQDFTGPSMFYSPNGYTSPTYPSSTYYYGGYDGSSGNEWDGFASADGVEMPQGMFGDYQHGYGYAPYGTYSPSGSHVGHDRQLYGPQQYQYPSSYFQSASSTSGSYPSNQGNTSQTAVSPSVAPDQVRFPAESTEANQSRVGSTVTHRTNTSKSVRPTYQNSSAKSSDSYGWGGMPSVSPWVSSAVPRGSNFSSGGTQNLRPLPHSVGMQHPRASSAMGGYMNQMYPNNRMYGQYGNAFRSGLGFSPSIYDLRTGGRDWLVADHKYRPRGRGNGLSANSNESADGLNELNRGPRGKGFKDQKDSEPISLAVKGQSLPLKGNCDEDNLPLFPDREQYNRDDFPETYTDAKFFVIKSYSEDDIHKSIKYGVWASTPNGNKKLDAAYREAEEKSGGCPVFLLFSVNASGQFVGLAEMIGPVDFDKTVEYWQQDKWNGCFPVKWHIVKDVPNIILRHITLENNENKPVTNSRDTQEVKSELGLQILQIFKTHSSKTCILDDFDFYEGRQKIMQEKKAKQRQLNKQVGNVNQSAASTQITEQDRPIDKEWSKIPASSGGSTGLPRSEDGELKPSEEIRSTTAAKDQPNAKDNEVLLNGTGSAC
ncbi:YTH domain-containing protein ECT4 isoform X1 [Nicotiana tabacum]|uniref:YTH domain-containing family protein n=1 Tax=Nicotiana tabacum TaxID=4097 RepID=A0A1S4C206_TOBAC|nr:YTH domain-containing protein ECT4-like isoform X1 [Nicotiana tomentosiformis]XP_009603416.1 YTH domain-containing protein ECT4-like isoform X1 [Nicotiana tomentosiformis]XP_009603417.1 YTH domain-containing protein ECT4-like isoform X1 [Nicotiana tomentosiformis]XP_016495118.1 PREDICTED: YTH domain-containing family protein 2-like isoform X1 [Nicotiana tabacum]XP_016495119.1 PREDICTED: YTH domain-containing family protein 2-like isoform X1 [Nicotiana tabacum]